MESGGRLMAADKASSDNPGSEAPRGAFAEGQSARRDHKPVSQNPHPEGTDAHRSWSNGWHGERPDDAAASGAIPVDRLNASNDD
jgi:hypothetical protein